MKTAVCDDVFMGSDYWLPRRLQPSGPPDCGHRDIPVRTVGAGRSGVGNARQYVLSERAVAPSGRRPAPRLYPPCCLVICDCASRVRGDQRDLMYASTSQICLSVSVPPKDGMSL